MTTTNTMETNYRNALKEIKAYGVKTKVNVMECCRSCVTNEKLGIANDDVAIIWQYGGQGHAVSWVNGLPVDRAELNEYKQSRSWYNLNRYMNNPAEHMVWGVWFNHNALTEEQRDKVYAIFTAHGFVVNWDKADRDAKCIEIDFKQTYQNAQAVTAEEAIKTDYAMC